MLEIEKIYYEKTTAYTSKWSQYFELYERYFNKFKNRFPTILEIGVDNGGSLQMWNEYFNGECTLYGVDNRPKFDFYNAVPHLGFAAWFSVGDQGNPQFWDDFKYKTPKFDIIIDDGSHFQGHQILTLKKMFDHMNDGGIYFVEDTHSSYMEHFDGARGKADTFIEFSKFIIDALHEDYDPTAPVNGWKTREGNLYRQVTGIHFHDSVVVLEKGLRPKAEVTYANRNNQL